MAFSESEGHAFDEVGIEEIYKKLNIPYYSKVDFAHLAKYETKFYLATLPKEEDYKNDRQVFTWENGKLYAIIYITVKSLKKNICISIFGAGLCRIR